MKSLTKGYATLDYEDAGWEPSDLVKMTVTLNDEPVDAMSVIVNREKAYYTVCDSHNLLT